MELVVLAVILLLLCLASQLGWTVDSRDNADWAPTQDVYRVTR